MADLTILEAFQNLSINLTALVFTFVLFIVTSLLRAKHSTTKRSFKNVTIVLMIGNGITSLSYFLSYTVLGDYAPSFTLFIYMINMIANIMIIFYIMIYIEGFFGKEHAPRHNLRVINHIVAAIAIVATFIMFFLLLPAASVFFSPNMVPSWFRNGFIFAIELYFLVYTIIFFRRGKRLLNRRSYITALVAFILTISMIVLEVFNVTGVIISYVGATLGVFIFYFGVEAPDYQELLKTVAQLEIAKKEADDANRAKSEFLAMMSHEIRTPINAILGMNEMILRESDNLDVRGYARNVESAGKSLLSLINDILDFSKLEAGRIEIIEAPYKLSSVLNDLTTMVRVRLKDRDIKFHVDVDESIPDELSGDETRIRQIITNLLSNAVKYTREGDIYFKVCATTRTDSSLELIAEVKDTGIGIREDDIDKLFVKFERVDTQKNRTIEGTGLGLPITKELANMMGGDIKVSSVYGEGSTFTARIPQSIVSPDPIGKFTETYDISESEPNSYRESFQAPDARILIVDDTEINLTVVEGLLKSTQVKINTATSGADALILTQELAYDLILMDQRMPELDGTETLARIRAQENGKNLTTPVICLTADAIVGAKNHYLSVGFSDYLTKPIQGRQLENAIVKYLPPEKVTAVSVSEIPDSDSELAKFYDEQPKLNYELAKQFSKNDELLVQTIKVFYDTIEDKIASITTAYEESDYTDYTTVVHALKSSARLVGAPHLSDMAKLLEDAGNKAKGGDESATKTIGLDTPALIEEYSSFKGIFASLFTEEATDKPMVSEELIKELYTAINEFLGVFDLEGIDTIIKEADKYSFPDNYKEEFESLKKAALHSDWEQIEKIAANH